MMRERFGVAATFSRCARNTGLFLTTSQRAARGTHGRPVGARKNPKRPPSFGRLLSTSLKTTVLFAPDFTSSTPSSRSEEHTSELQSQSNLVCRLLLDKNTHP